MCSFHQHHVVLITFLSSWYNPIINSSADRGDYRNTNAMSSIRTTRVIARLRLANRAWGMSGWDDICQAAVWERVQDAEPEGEVPLLQPRMASIFGISVSHTGTREPLRQKKRKMSHWEKASLDMQQLRWKRIFNHISQSALNMQISAVMLVASACRCFCSIVSVAFPTLRPLTLLVVMATFRAALLWLFHLRASRDHLATFLAGPLAERVLLHQLFAVR